jgi:hypothetical protein
MRLSLRLSLRLAFPPWSLIDLPPPLPPAVLARAIVRGFSARRAPRPRAQGV